MASAKHAMLLAVFKYNGKFYQDVNNFCDNYDGLKIWCSKARAQVVNTEFTKSAYLVIPGHSKDNYKRIPAEWKNGTQDLSVLKNAAYLLGKRKRPTGERLLLVPCKELKRAAASALGETQRKKTCET